MHWSESGRKRTSTAAGLSSIDLRCREEVPAAEEHAAEPILISDDESEGRANSAASDPAPQPGAEPCLQIPPITALAPGQRSVPSESQPWQARIEEFEGAVRQTISLVELGMGTWVALTVSGSPSMIAWPIYGDQDEEVEDEEDEQEQGEGEEEEEEGFIAMENSSQHSSKKC
ncbi:nucleosome assembly protein 1-like 5 [Asparagus officinalis]|uniref:nucleosome assembly protein 1-like 5 n=1 Tax=Asparagus officinalis TaxID=4686 RepID=UPI00098DFE6A|nr:nucleosome assembly protein 1-like 5 [Asparagus officinalis]